MKKLLTVIAVAFTLASCVKQASHQLAPIENIDKVGYEKMQKYYEGVDRNLPSDVTARRGNPNQFYFTCADSWNEESKPPAKGLAAEVDVVKLRIGSATMKSWWIAITNYYTDANGNQIKDWSQFGYAADKGGIFPAYFRYRWNLTQNTGGGQAPPEIIYSGINVPLEIGTKVRFEIKNIEGTTWWAFSRSGQEVFRANLEFSSATGVFEACTESWGSPDFAPALMTSYLDLYRNGQWSHVSTGVSNQYSWGIAAHIQDEKLGPSQFVMGGNTPVLPNNVIPWLWGKP